MVRLGRPRGGSGQEDAENFLFRWFGMHIWKINHLFVNLAGFLMALPCPWNAVFVVFCLLMRRGRKTNRGGCKNGEEKSRQNPRNESTSAQGFYFFFREEIKALGLFVRVFTSLLLCCSTPLAWWAGWVWGYSFGKRKLQRLHAHGERDEEPIANPRFAQTMLPNLGSQKKKRENLIFSIFAQDVCFPFLTLSRESAAGSKGGSSFGRFIYFMGGKSEPQPS